MNVAFVTKKEMVRLSVRECVFASESMRARYIICCSQAGASSKSRSEEGGQLYFEMHTPAHESSHHFIFLAEISTLYITNGLL